MHTKDEYIDKMAAELKDWSAQLDRFSIKADSATASAKLTYEEEIAALRVQQKSAMEKMAELQAYSGDAWDSVKETADKVWDDLRSGFHDATAKFK